MSAPKDHIFRVDAEACKKGGRIGGQYLEEIGKSDLGELTDGEWLAFLMKVVGGALLASVGDVYGDQTPF